MISVLELSSFQLDGMGEAKVSPNVSVLTNIYEDHINWHGSMEEYIKAKKNIFLNQTEKDYLVVNIDNNIASEFVNEAPSHVITFSLSDNSATYYIDESLNIFEKGSLLLKLENLKLEGRHNLYNILGAVATTRLFGINVEEIKSVVESFEGVENRQEFVREIDGVKYYNDTCATSVESMQAMIERFSKEYSGKIIQIAGGVDKGMDYHIIANDMKRHLKALILLQGTASEKMYEFVGDALPVYHFYNSIEDAVNQAKELAEEGDIVILSPGGSSFNMFVNEFDRGEKFVNAVNNLS